MTIPKYLQENKLQYVKDPREANYGLFLHYGLYPALKKHEWVMFREQIHVKEYEKLKENFTAEGFDAKAYVDLAKAAGMKYINITTRHQS